MKRSSYPPLWRRLPVVLLALAVVAGACGRASAQPSQEYYARQMTKAQQGDALAQYNLGLRYLKGEGMGRDERLAIQWIRASITNQTAGSQLSPALRLEAQETLRRLEERVPPQPTISPESSRTPNVTASNAVAVPGKPQSGAPGGSAGTEASEATGSGFFVSDDGYFLTCFHVVKGATRIAVRFHLGVLPAQLIKVDPTNDLALLKVQGKFRALPLARPGKVSLGEPVFTVGFPNVSLQGLEPKLTRGEISSLAGFRDDPRYFQTSVAMQPGNSGGPLLNSVGDVVGVVTMRLSDSFAFKASGMLPQNVNYALKREAITSFLASSPGLRVKLKASHRARERKFEEVAREAQEATALVIAQRSVAR